MCGIAGIHAYLDVAPPVDRAELERINDRMAARGPDGNGLWLCRRRAHGARPSAARHHRPERGRRAADAQRLRPLHHHLQRRDLQLPRAARGAGRARLRLPQRLRHRGAAAALCRLRRRHGEEAARHVRLRPVGRREAHAAAGARCAGHQAALLGRRRLDGALRLAGQGAAGRRPGRPRSRSGRHRGLPPVRQRARALHGLARGPHAAGRHDAHDRRQRAAIAEALLRRRRRSGRARQRPPWRSAMRAGCCRTPCAIRCAITWWPTCRWRCSCRPVSIRARCSAPWRRRSGAQSVSAVTLAFAEFKGLAVDEAPLAAEVARRYGARHIVRTVDRAEFERDLPAILDAMDLPTIDGINTWFVAKAAHEAGIKVALSGLGRRRVLRRLSVVRRRAAQRALAAPVVVRARARSAGAARSVGRDRCRPRAASQGGGPAAVWRRLGRRLSSAPQRLHAVGARRADRSGAGGRRPAPPGAAQPHRGRPAWRPAARRLRPRGRARDGALHAQPAAARRRLGRHVARRGDPRALCRSVLPRRPAVRRRSGARQRQGRGGRRARAAAAGGRPRAAQDGLRDAGRPLAARGSAAARRPGTRWISPLPRAAGRYAYGRTAGRRRWWPDAR